MAKLTAKDLDAMSSEYGTPEPREKPTTVAEFETQQEAASFVKDFLKLSLHGAGHGLGEEAIAGVKTGSLSSPEYLAERNKLRGSVEQSRTNVGAAAPFIEGLGAEAVTAALPVMKGAQLAKRLISAGVQGVGEAPEMADVPSSALVSAGAQGVAEGAGALLKQTLFNDPTAILSRTVGTKGSDIKMRERADIGRDLPGAFEIKTKSVGGIPVDPQPQQRAILGSIDRLDQKGFFKQGNKVFDPAKRAFVRTKDSLSGFLKPQTLDDLYSTASQGLTSLKAANEKLLRGKNLPAHEVRWELENAVADLTYDPTGYNMQGMEELATEVKNTIIRDMKGKKMWLSNTGKIDALDLENTKRAVDSMISSTGFKKKAEDLGVSDEALMEFRTRFDGLLDKMGGNDYKLNNDAMYDLKNVQDMIWEKQGRKYVDVGGRLVDQRRMGERLMDSTLNHPSMSILRSGISKATETPASQFGMGVLKRMAPEGFVQDTGEYPVPQEEVPQEIPQYNVVPKSFSGVMRNPSSIGFSPKEIINYRIPRTTQGIVENKDRVLAKLVQNGVPDQMVDTISHALNGNVEDLGNIAPLLLTQFPNMFERSKYKVFDGAFIDPNDKAKAADSISKRDDLNSIQRAKMINQINKKNEMPEGM